MLSSILLLVFFYGMIAWALCVDGGFAFLIRTRKSFSLRHKYACCVLIVFVFVFALYWIRQNRFAYYWDWAGYWTISVNRMRFMEEGSFKDIMKSLFLSINLDEYNVFLPSVLALPLRVIGCSYIQFVMTCLVLFFLPSIFLFGLTAAKMLEQSDAEPGSAFLLSATAAAFFPASWYIALRGFIDLGCLLPMTAAMYLFVDYDLARVSVKKNAALSAVLILTWICRRYTVFFIIGYILAMLFKAGVFLWKHKNIPSLKRVLLNLGELAAISLAIGLLLFKQFIIRTATTNYRGMYSAYDTPLAEKLSGLAQSFGYISVAMVILVGIMCLVSRSQIINYLSFVLMGAATALSFWTVQNMGVQHRMLLLSPLFLICVLGLSQWKEKSVTAAFCALALCFNFLAAFSRDLPSSWNGTVFSERYAPLQRNDIRQLHRLKELLAGLTEESRKHVYIAASGHVLNNDILRKLDMPDTDDALPNMLPTSDVDLRDGFPTGFLTADYVVATDPIQTHLPSGQQAVSYLAQEVQDADSYLGRHFHVIEQITLDSGVTAFILQKDSEFTDDDLHRLSAYYTALYPENTELFSDRIENAVSVSGGEA